MLKLFAASCFVKEHTSSTSHIDKSWAGYVYAKSEDEALGMALRELRKAYHDQNNPGKFTEHSVVLLEVPQDVITKVYASYES